MKIKEPPSVLENIEKWLLNTQDVHELNDMQCEIYIHEIMQILKKDNLFSYSKIEAEHGEHELLQAIHKQIKLVCKKEIHELQYHPAKQKYWQYLKRSPIVRKYIDTSKELLA